MKNDLNILIIDSDPSVIAGLEKSLNYLGLRHYHTAAPGIDIDQLNAISPELAILGPSLKTETCLKCIHTLKIIDPAIPVLTSLDDVCNNGVTINAPFEGLHCFLPGMKPDKILMTIEDSLRHKAECRSRPDFQLIIGQSQEIIRVRQQIRKVCDKDITVLITGETGTGKELIARSIHYHSSRSNGPLVKINCGAIPEELLESEVLGFQKGAFTGACKNKSGRLEMANGGTLFIDEIGSLPLSLQVKFLQVLEEKGFSRLGGTFDKAIDARIVAATNSDLSKMMSEGTFRKDLFFRLNVVQIKAPPLRSRMDDIPLLIHYFLNKYSYEFKKKIKNMPQRVINLFMAYHWPGNVREVENLIRRAIALSDWDFVYNQIKIQETNQNQSAGIHPGNSANNTDWEDNRIKSFIKEEAFSLKKITRTYVSEVEHRAIRNALKKTSWNRKKAARLLKVSYKTLLNRIEEFDIKP